MAARRLHLPTPPSLNHITHVYNTADPIPNGVCTGSASSCGVAGYALESKYVLMSRIHDRCLMNPVDVQMPPRKDDSLRHRLASELGR
jgi:hypothetical protein